MTPFQFPQDAHCAEKTAEITLRNEMQVRLWFDAATSEEQVQAFVATVSGSDVIAASSVLAMTLTMIANLRPMLGADGRLNAVQVLVHTTGRDTIGVMAYLVPFEE